MSAAILGTRRQRKQFPGGRRARPSYSTNISSRNRGNKQRITSRTAPTASSARPPASRYQSNPGFFVPRKSEKLPAAAPYRFPEAANISGILDRAALQCAIAHKASD